MKHWLTFAWHFLLSLLCFWFAVEDFEQAIAGEDVRWNLISGLTSFALSISFYCDAFYVRRCNCGEEQPDEETPPEDPQSEDAQPAEQS